MSRAQLTAELQEAIEDLSDQDLEEELAGVLPDDEFAGLAIRVRAAIDRISDLIAGD